MNEPESSTNLVTLAVSALIRVVGDAQTYALTGL